MKQALFSFAFLLLAGCGFSQISDSLLMVKRVDTLLTTATEFRKAEKYEEALDRAQQATNISKQKWGENNEKYAAALQEQARIYDRLSQYTKAEELGLKTIGIRAAVLGNEHPDYVSSLNFLGYLYYNKGYYAKAEPLYSEALEIRTKTLSKEDSNYVKAVENLASVSFYNSNYAKAESLYLELLGIHAKTLGKEHPKYAFASNTLGVLYMFMGDYDKAEPLLLEAIEIKAKTLGKKHLEYARALDNLAALYYNKGDYEKAEPFFLEAMEIRKDTLGKEHEAYAASLNNLAVLYMDLGDYEKAEPFILEAIEIKEKTLGKEHPGYARSLDNLASLCIDKGNYEKAKALHVEAAEIRAKVLGKKHPDYALSLYNLALLYWQTGKNELVAPLMAEAASIQRTLLLNGTEHLSEQELSQYKKTFVEAQDHYYSFAHSAGNISGEMPRLCFDNRLFYNGFVLMAAEQMRRLASSDTSAARIYLEWISLANTLAEEYTKPRAMRDTLGIADLEEKANILEKELVKTVIGYKEAKQQVYWHEVQAKLQPDEAVIEFVNYRYFTPTPTDSVYYAALILRPDDASPQFIPLCEQRQIDSLISQTPGADNKDLISKIYFPPRDGKPGLYELLFQPLDALLQNVTTIFYSPSGSLHRLNLAAIYSDSRKNLGDKYNLVMVGSTRELALQSPHNTSNWTSSATIYGGIQYEMDSVAISKANLEFSEPAQTRGNFYLFSIDKPSDNSWKFIPESVTEAQKIKEILTNEGITATLRKGLAATEESFKNIGKNTPSPRILHIATHGFFSSDPKANYQLGSFSNGENVFITSENPMIRSGLIFAGANLTWTTGHSLANAEDGILTAYEIAQMDLSNTELVVLSACETGLGDIYGDEGVYGLQRAFKIAGAKTLIMSLWRIPDEQTQELMITFYKKWQVEKMPVREAFKAAQREIRREYPNPFYWAGFVLL